MSLTFYVLALVMVLAAGLLVVFLPRVWRHDVRGESSLDWFRLREAELLDESPELLRDAELRAVEELDESGDGNAPASGTNGSVGAGRGGRVPLILLLLVIAFIPFALYQRVGALPDIEITETLANLESASAAQVAALVEDIEGRVEVRPDNGDYLSLLGQYYMGNEQYAKAFASYQQLATLYPESPEVLARAAQAEYLKDNRRLTPRARGRAEAALAADPNQRTALGVLGMATFEQGDYDTALRYWERLLAFEAPGTPGHDMLSRVMAEARSRAGGPEAARSGAKVVVTVAIPANTELNPEAVVFVIARPAGSAQRMPTAVVRRGADSWPLMVTLDDTASMAGQQLSALERVDIEVQVSPDGQPGREAASWVGTARDVILSTDTAVEITLTPTQP